MWFFSKAATVSKVNWISHYDEVCFSELNLSLFQLLWVDGETEDV